MFNIVGNNTTYTMMENIPSNETFIFMSNHVSLDDISFLDEFLPKHILFLVHKNEQKHNENILKNRKHMVYEQLTPNLLIELINLLKNNQSILVFPENRISCTGNVMQIYQEFTTIALKTNIDIYPVHLKNAERGKNSPSSHLFLNRTAPVEVFVGKRFNLLEDCYNTSDDKTIYSNFIYKKLNELKYLSLEKRNVNLFDELVLSSKLHGDSHIILKDLSAEVSYRKLLLSIHTLSRKFQSTIKDNTVGVLLPNSIGHVATLFSLFKLGIRPAILNFTMGVQNLLDCCETADLKTILTSREFIEKGDLTALLDVLKEKHKIIFLEDLKETITTKEKLLGLSDYSMSKKSDSVLNEVILFTSGSENKPKGVILTHDNIYANIQQARSVIDITPSDYILNALPMFHSFGLSVGSILPVLLGVKVLLYPTPLHYKMIPELSYQENVSILFGTSTFLQGYGKHARAYDFHKTRFVIAGAEKLKEEVKTLWSEKFGIRILEGYGVTESSPILSLNSTILYKSGTVGHFLPSLEYKIEPVEGIDNGGSLFVKGPNIMKGYLIHNKGFIKQDGWYDTGDVVEMDDEGFIKITSRLKRFAKIAGEMVSLNLLEELATKCFENDGFAAVNVPDKKKGEKIILFTTNAEIKERVFKKYLKTNNHSMLLLPAEIVTVESIPLLGSGKTDYVSIKKIAEEMYSK